MYTLNRFRKIDIDVLSKRVANSCSNPDCVALTAGPAENSNASVNIGEASHIYGAEEGSVRYDSSMTSSMRADITNAIWLCCNCHKLIDSDPVKYPARLLYEWRRAHEKEIAANIGKTGANLRQKSIERELRDFEKESYLAQQIVIDKPEIWEYKLTAELLRSKLSPISSRWRSLKESLYVRHGIRMKPFYISHVKFILK